MKTRKEKDALGEMAVPAESYAGIFAARAKKHFTISSLRAPYSFYFSLARIKYHAAAVNTELKLLPLKDAKAIQKAAEEFTNGKFKEDSDLDIYQAGAGTPYNMTINEILANRANEILAQSKAKRSPNVKGTYSPVHPNDHVNLGQSSNDVIPTALRIAALLELTELMAAGLMVVDALEEKGKEFGKILKVGRTHLQDAVPVTLGQEFEAYASAITHALNRIDLAAGELTTLGLGATAVGTGINSHPKFGKKMAKAFSEDLGFSFTTGNLFENNHSMAVFQNLSAALRSLASELLRVCNDLRLMASGPDAGFNEIRLPEIEPGSSIMPGKVNPSILECVSMICVQVQGLDYAISMASQQGQLELNWYTPLIAWDLLHQIQILSNGMDLLRENCIEGIDANEDEMRKTLDRSSVLATAIVPELGYEETAILVKKAKASGKPLSSLLDPKLKKGLKAEKLTKANLT